MFVWTIDKELEEFQQLFIFLLKSTKHSRQQPVQPCIYQVQKLIVSGQIGRH